MSLQQEYKYPLDESGVSNTNLIPDEPHVIEAGRSKVIIPLEGGFYTAGLSLTLDGGRPLIRGKDYKFLFLYEEATMALGHEVCVGIIITNQTLIGTFRLRYQIPGSRFSGQYAAIKQAVANLNEADYTLTWDQLKGKPTEFNGEDHCHTVEDWRGFGGMIDETKEITKAIKEGNAERLKTLQEGLVNKLDNLGHTKLPLHDGQIRITRHDGPIELTFGRSNLNQAMFALELRIITPTGTHDFVVTARETDGAFTSIAYSGTGISDFSVPMLLRTLDSKKNKLVLGLNSTTWTDTIVIVRTITVEDTYKDDYNAGWNWSKSVDQASYDEDDMVTPSTEISNISQELTTVHVNVRNLASLIEALSDKLNLHIAQTEDAHKMEEAIDDGQVEVITQVKSELDRGVSF